MITTGHDYAESWGTDHWDPFSTAQIEHGQIADLCRDLQNQNGFSQNEEPIIRLYRKQQSYCTQLAPNLVKV